MLLVSFLVSLSNPNFFYQCKPVILSTNYDNITTGFINMNKNICNSVRACFTTEFGKTGILFLYCSFCNSSVLGSNSTWVLSLHFIKSAVKVKFSVSTILRYNHLYILRYFSWLHRIFLAEFWSIANYVTEIAILTIVKSPVKIWTWFVSEKSVAATATKVQYLDSEENKV